MEIRDKKRRDGGPAGQQVNVLGELGVQS